MVKLENTENCPLRLTAEDYQLNAFLARPQVQGKV
jgi:hypothetical protein